MLSALPFATVHLQVLHTLRCILHGGQDPTLLKHEQIDYKKDTNTRVVEYDYLLERLRRAPNSLKTLVSHFIECVAAVDYSLPSSSNEAEEFTPVRRGSVSSFQSLKKMTLAEELAFYGLPPAAVGGDMQEEDHHSTATSIDAASKQANHASWLSEMIPMGEADIVTMRELTQGYQDLFMDITNHSNSSAFCAECGLCGAILVIMQKDFIHDLQDRRLPVWLDLLWTCLEDFLADRGEDYQRRYFLMKNDIVLDITLATNVCKTILMHYLLHGHKQFDKECRNEVIIVLTLLADFPKAIGHFLSSGVVDILLTYSCIEETARGPQPLTQPPWAFFIQDVANSRNFATIADVDVEFKKSVWLLLSKLMKTNDHDILLAFAASPLMPCLLSYLEADPSDNSTTTMSGGGGMKTTNTSISLEGGGLFGTSKSLAPPGGSGFLLQVHPWDDPLSKSYSQDDMNRKNMTMSTSRFKPKTSSLQVSTKYISPEMLGIGVAKGIIASYSTNKLREFQLQASLLLLQHAPKVLGEFERLEGPYRILTLAIKFARQDNPIAKKIVGYCLLLVYRCLCNSITVCKSLAENQIIETLLELFVHCNTSSQGKGTPGNGAGEDEINQAEIMRIIAKLCSGSHALPCQQQFLQYQGMQVLLQPLRQYISRRPAVVGQKAALKINLQRDSPDPLPDPLDNLYGGEISPVIIAILDCCQCAIIGNERNELRFADLEGVDTLLDLLETSPFILRLQVLRLLSNLLMNHQLVIFAKVWRSAKTLRSAGLLLCHAWMDEETRLDSERKNSKGVICDLFHPLGNQIWPKSEKEQNIVLLTRSELAATTANIGGKNTMRDLFTQSVTVNKLATAILAGRNAVQTNLPVDTCEKALACDQRVVLASLMDHLGLFEVYNIADASNPFRSHLALSESTNAMPSPAMNSSTEDTQNNVLSTDAMLSPKERQVLVMAKKFNVLIEGSWWQEVATYIENLNVVPIEADLAIMRKRLDGAFDAAIATQTEQMELCDVEEGIKKESEDQLLEQILTKKQQQIKAEWLKRRTRTGGKRPGASTKLR